MEKTMTEKVGDGKGHERRRGEGQDLDGEGGDGKDHGEGGDGKEHGEGGDGKDHEEGGDGKDHGGEGGDGKDHGEGGDGKDHSGEGGDGKDHGGEGGDGKGEGIGSRRRWDGKRPMVEKAEMERTRVETEKTWWRWKRPIVEIGKAMVRRGEEKTMVEMEKTHGGEGGDEKRSWRRWRMEKDQVEMRADTDLEKTMVVKEVMAGVVDMEGMVGAVMVGDHTHFHIGKVVADTGQADDIGLEAGGLFLVGDGEGGCGGIMVVATRRRLRNLLMRNGS
ncbi:hypothetical protein Tco_1264744 [Tanacetum coccineum]